MESREDINKEVLRIGRGCGKSRMVLKKFVVSYLEDGGFTEEEIEQICNSIDEAYGLH